MGRHCASAAITEGSGLGRLTVSCEGTVDGTLVPRRTLLEELREDSVQDPDANPYQGSPIGTRIGTPMAVVHADATGYITTTRAGVPRLSHGPLCKLSLRLLPSTMCRDTTCAICFPPKPAVKPSATLVRFHYVRDGEVATQVASPQSISVTGPKKYVACEDVTCKLCTEEANARKRVKKGLRRVEVWLDECRA